MNFVIDKFMNKLHQVETTVDEGWIQNHLGDNIYIHVHRPVKPGKFPGVVMVPGGKSHGTMYDKGGELTAADLASMGFSVLHYDPSGRGRSSGKEDYWGVEHQKELAVVLDHFSKNSFTISDNMGVLSFSMGITIASGALATYDLPFVKYLFDWEGPSNKFNITKDDTYEPLKDFPTSDLEFWQEREASKYISHIKCYYFRYQSINDHVQGRYKGHAIELVNLATKGCSPWTRLNDNPPNIFFNGAGDTDCRWVPWYANHKQIILKYFLDLYLEAMYCTKL